MANGVARLVLNSAAFVVFFSLLISIPSLLAEDLSKLGGDLSTSIGGYGLQAPAPNVSSQELTLQHISGFGHFHKHFNLKSGLGPRFINPSCGGCHFRNGKGAVESRSKRRLANTLVVKVSTAIDAIGKPLGVPGIGLQIQTHSNQTENLHQIKLRWKKLQGLYPDGSTYKLRTPKLRFQLPGIKRNKVYSSLRMAPMIVGLGLLEAISDSSIISLSDPEDLNNDGISGKVNYVWDRQNNKLAIGRFGFKASQPNLLQQSALAAFRDMGISNSIFQKKAAQNIELSDQALEDLVTYQSVAGVPTARSQDQPKVLQGKKIFQEVNCNSCHIMSIQTGTHKLQELSDQTIHPFTDLLLHDMGEALKDDYPEFSANGREWRTTPLWGIGLAATIAKHKPRYLHDGRARNLEEAILWHDGEAKNSQMQFMALDQEQRLALLAFLRSL